MLVRDSLTAIILTKNEAIHIERCIKSILCVTDRIYVIDSFSTDITIDILEKNGVAFEQREWLNYSDQYAYAMRSDPWGSEYQIRMDADEYLDDHLVNELLYLNGNFDSFAVRRKLFFNGTWIKHGGYYPIWLTRIYRSSLSHIENQNMDEHIIVEGNCLKLRGNIVDDNRNAIDWWTNKHLKYADREVIDLVNLRSRKVLNVGSLFSSDQAMRKRWYKHNIYLRFPPALRVTSYFVLRYFIKLGFLDGKNGFYWHFFQAFWYRTMVEYKYLRYESTEAK